MSTKAGVGMSYHHNPNVAGREAAEQALQKAGLERVMNLGGNRIEMRIPRLDWFPRDLRFPHS